MLKKSKMIGFIPSTNLDDAKSFYANSLCLSLIKFDEYALEFEVGDARLRVTQVPELNSAAYTVLGWEVDDIEATVEELSANGVEFEQYVGLNQNELGICTFPDENKVAWFKDPDGNVLSITQFSQ